MIQPRKEMDMADVQDKDVAITVSSTTITVTVQVPDSLDYVPAVTVTELSSTRVRAAEILTNKVASNPPLVTYQFTKDGLSSNTQYDVEVLCSGKTFGDIVTTLPSSVAADTRVKVSQFTHKRPGP
jgi:hypothetical protein